MHTHMTTQSYRHQGRGNMGSVGPPKSHSPRSCKTLPSDPFHSFSSPLPSLEYNCLRFSSLEKKKKVGKRKRRRRKVRRRRRKRNFTLSQVPPWSILLSSYCSSQPLCKARNGPPLVYPCPWLACPALSLRPEDSLNFIVPFLSKLSCSQDPCLLLCVCVSCACEWLRVHRSVGTCVCV